MINPKELRIGNLVQYKSQLRGWIVDVVHKEYFKSDSLDNVKGIPISEQWLNNFSFKEEENLDQEKFKKIFLNDLGYRVSINIDNRFTFWIDLYGFGIDFNYVHEFQNIYFALTKHELETKSQENS
jgi:hypothetical protein